MSVPCRMAHYKPRRRNASTIVQSGSMRILVFSDIHNDLPALRRLMATDADYYVTAGDLVSWERGLESCGEILKAKAGKVWVIPGNHESADLVSLFCTKYGLRDIHDDLFELDGVWFGGLGYSSPTPFNTPGEYSEEQLARRLSRFTGVDNLIMICHAPPYGTDLDRVREGLHAGSESVKYFIDSTQPEYFFCGHIHEAEGKEIRMGKTTAINVGKRGYLLEL
jgi:Icc-related predicted phosphoesterase